MLSKLCQKDMCRCAEGGCTGARKGQAMPTGSPIPMGVTHGALKALTQWTLRRMALGLPTPMGGRLSLDKKWD